MESVTALLRNRCGTIVNAQSAITDFITHSAAISAGYGYEIPSAYFEGFEPAFATFPPLRIDPVIPPPPPLTCSRSRETVTVPAESGGTREITITRC